jgi:hypothetical protein
MWLSGMLHPKILEAYFYNVAMFSLSRPILLMGLRARNMMFNAYFLKGV